MNDAFPYALAADAIGVVHALIVLFNVGGLAMILVGWVQGGTGHWAWTRNRVFRWVHLSSVAIVLGLAALGQWCPLTLWESELRRQAGQAGFEQGFIATWLDRLLYYDAPVWVFAIIYAAFFAVVLAAWRFYPMDNGAGGRT